MSLFVGFPKAFVRDTCEAVTMQMSLSMKLGSVCLREKERLWGTHFNFYLDCQSECLQSSIFM